jgi:trimeric autotransporter adhesin
MKKIYNVMASAAVLASLAVPASAFASSTYSTPTGVTATQANSTISTTTRVAVKIDPGSLTSTNGSVIVRLPADAYGVATAIAPATVGNSNNAVDPASVTLTPNAATQDVNDTSAYREFTLHVNPNAPTVNGVTYDYSNNDGLVYIDFTKLYVPSVSDNLNVTFDAQNGSAFSSGTVTVANVSSGKVDVTVDDTASISQSGDKIAPIRVKEDQKGAFAHDSGNTVLSVKLPNGFSWHNLTGTVTIPVVAAGSTAPTPNGPYIQQIWGAGEWATVAPTTTTNGSATVTISADGRKASIVTSGRTTATPNYFAIQGLTVDVDSTVAKTGSIDAALGGDSTVNESDLILGNYGELGATATIGGTPATERAGRNADNDLNSGFLTIQENAANSLISGRTIKLTLGGNAKWDTDSNGQPVGPVVDSSASDLQGLSSNFTWGWVGTDKTTIEAKLYANSESKPGKIVFKKGDIDVAADAADQDVTLTLGGTQGLTATGTIAKIVSPVKVTVNGDAPNLKIGVQNQALNPIDITEAVSGSLDAGSSNNQVTLKFPLGVTVHNPQSVSVTSGDLVLADASNISTGTDPNGKGYLTFNIKSTSSKASTVEVKGLSVDVNRMVSEGALNVEVTGSALNENGGALGTVFPNVTKVGSYTVANVVTPAPGETTANATFTIGKTSYTVNGVQKTLDVAPFTEGGRTYLPIRFVAEALGVSDDNIIWNDATKTVTLINGDRIASFKVGQSSYTVNGSVVPMDAAAQFKQNRNMIPLRYAAQALGVAIGWDDATQTVTVGSAAQK